MFLKDNKKGFTLVELLVVISIISLLASFSIVSLGQARVKARNANRLGEMNNVRKALQLYYDNNLEYPIVACSIDGSDNDWSGGNYQGATNDCYNDLSDYLEPYIRKMPSDPFGRGDFEYRYVSNGSVFRIFFKLEETQGVGEPDYIEGK